MKFAIRILAHFLLSFFLTTTVIAQNLLVDGRIGIGTTTPLTKLDIDGDIVLRDGTGRINFFDGTTEEANFRYDGASLILETTITGGDIFLDAEDDILLRSKDDFLFQNANGDNLIFIQENGETGIGTSSPISNLHILSDSWTDLRLESTIVGTDPFIHLQAPGGFWAVHNDDSGNNGLDFRWEGLTQMSLSTDGGVSISTSDNTEKLNIGNGGIITRDDIGQITTEIGRLTLPGISQPYPEIRTYGPNGTANVRLTTRNGEPNNGSIAVYDENGEYKAGISAGLIGTGSTVEADLKKSRTSHLVQREKDIVYAGLEGPEAGAYERGTATLKNGEAFVPFSDHFQLMINPTSMTVQITPLSTDTYGLAVIEKSPRGFRVKEFKGGTGNFEFDWEVKAVRKGYENYQVVQDKRENLFLEIEQDQPVPIQESAFEDLKITPPSAMAKARLSPNVPNPFTEDTTIKFFIPESIEAARLVITDANGTILENNAISSPGEGQFVLKRSTLPVGTYYYSLWLDGKLFETKKMVLIK